MEVNINDYDYELEYDIDLDFWKDLNLPKDIEEAYEENVRDCIDFFESTY